MSLDWVERSQRITETDWQYGPITAILPSFRFVNFAMEEEGHKKESHDPISINLINIV